MKHMKESSENEMILEFLKAEIESKRFRESILSALKELELTKNIIYNADINNEHENNNRKRVMVKHRNYGENKGLFENFPTINQWKWVSLCNDDINKIKYINYDYWIELSGGTRLPNDAAMNIFRGVEVFGVPNDGFFEAAKALINGVKFPPMILIADYNEEQVIILEGHVRLTAYAMKPEYMNQIQAIVGYCSKNEILKWDSAET